MNQDQVMDRTERCNRFLLVGLRGLWGDCDLVFSRFISMDRRPAFTASFLMVIAYAGLFTDCPAFALQSPGPTIASDAGDAKTAETTAERAKRLLAQSPPLGDLQHAHQLLQTARAVGRDGDFETASRLLHAALEHHLADPSSDHHQVILGLRGGIAAAAWQLKDYRSVVEQSEAILAMPQRGDDANGRIGAMHLLAKALSLLDQHERSLEVTRRLALASDVARSLAADHSLVIGSAALRSGQPTVAGQAYQFYLTHMPGGSRIADAELGIAWAAVSDGQQAQQADQLLASFITNHVGHRDIPVAMAARATVLDRLNRHDEATQLRLGVITDYPESSASDQVLDEYVRTSVTPWPTSVRQRWKHRLDRVTTQSQQISATTYASLLVGSLDASDDSLWRAAVAALLRTDAQGSLTSEVLANLSAPQSSGSPGDQITARSHVAEHLAIEVMGRLVDHAKLPESDSGAVGPAKTETQKVPAGCESACRWAGASGRWSMLAMLANDLSIPRRDDPKTLQRGVAIDRMIAESLMQTHRGGDALPWWLAILEVWQCEDFPTLVRAAETAVAFGTVIVASERLEAAKAAAAGDRFKLSLTQMLEAELAIRRARLDEARDLLAVIVRASDTAAELRPRAQWLIGETYFLQERYSEAIDAYRRVDTLDTEGQWAALALLQAGKAFEKLARPREAATCYTALLTRFSDLPHANHARNRLAQLGGDTTIRR